MSTAPGHYDEALLATAPTSTKAQRQEGYSTDLLNSPSGTATPPISTTQADVERGLVHKEYDDALKKPTPFFRTRKGIFIIAVLVIVILAAVIGGAVGGSAHHHQDELMTNASTSSSANPISSVTSSGSPGDGGLGPSTSTANPTSSANSTSSSSSGDGGLGSSNSTAGGLGSSNSTAGGLGSSNSTQSNQINDTLQNGSGLT